MPPMEADWEAALAEAHALPTVLPSLIPHVPLRTEVD